MGLRLPVAFQFEPLQAFHRARGQVRLVGAERLHPRALQRLLQAPVLHAVQVQLRRHPVGLLGGDQIARLRRVHHQRRCDFVAQRHVPDLGRGLVVAGHDPARNLGRGPGVLVATEVESPARVGRAVVQLHRAAAEPLRARIGLARQAHPAGTVGGHQVEHGEDGVAGGLDALGVLLPRVRLHQHPEAVAVGHVTV